MGGEARDLIRLDVHLMNLPCRAKVAEAQQPTIYHVYIARIRIVYSCIYG
ncbi:hypothetical protein FB555_000763 [Alpinimonas psychrophila]|uniref:Uncharacterized protein n=1 Tax=Alpinimonas psychrophila TaxID=748908 RepID=A0A7W3PNQ7_9MICO|nr:hypothetical protein [Alpinimonas psychrophila]